MKTTNLDATASDRRFDHAMQSRYSDAVENVSARTQARLHNRLRAAMTAPKAPGAHRPAWAMAVACSLVLATVVGLQLRTPERPARAHVATADVNADNGELLASLDEAPDLYLWLASDDATALVSEPP